jgi:flavin reductase (DIM6/NTAB) family NADH-FMN oxidoreductase RutF
MRQGHQRLRPAGLVEFDPATRGRKANYQFLTSAVAPRPIAWITTVDPATGVVNAAPFSWYNAVCADPPLVSTAIFERAPGVPKDTLRNLRATGDYVVNVATRETVKAMVQTSGDYPPDVSEVKALNLATLPSRKVAPPRLAASPVHLECRLRQELPFGNGEQRVWLVIGEVVHMHADDRVLDATGQVDPKRVTFAARMGGQEYSDTRDFFTQPRPTQADLTRAP